MDQNSSNRQRFTGLIAICAVMACMLLLGTQLGFSKSSARRQAAGLLTYGSFNFTYLYVKAADGTVEKYGPNATAKLTQETSTNQGGLSDVDYQNGYDMTVSVGGSAIAFYPAGRWIGLNSTNF